ncbi:MAG: ABC transporter permease [Ginsengibacter sp.]
MEFPEVLQSTRVFNYGGDGASINIDDKVFAEKKILAVDSNFFQVFTGSFLTGDVNTALQKPGTAVVNESTAKRYFGSVENAMGKNLKVEFRQFTITECAGTGPGNLISNSTCSCLRLVSRA